MIIKNEIPAIYAGCDSVVRFDEEKRFSGVKLLQLTDMQFIDASQSRTPDRLKENEKKEWVTENFDLLCGNQIKSLVAQARPDIIFITGDMVYGEFDDSGRFFTRFCEFMESFEIPWAPVFGNHDNETKKGVVWQCEMLEKCKYCLFKRGNVSGNGNYVVGIAHGDKLVNVMYMLDSNGCAGSQDENVIRYAGIYPDQKDFIKNRGEEIRRVQGNTVPSIVAFHIPTVDFIEAEKAKGYTTEGRKVYNIGVDVPARDGDFGCNCEYFKSGAIEAAGLKRVLKDICAKGVFVGHYHCINTCILYDGIKWTFGLKTGKYDYHNPGQLGGTLVRIAGDDLEINHLCAIA